MQLLGGHEREIRLRQVKAHLVAEDAQRAGTGPVFLARARVANVPHHVEILFHLRPSTARSAGLR